MAQSRCVNIFFDIGCVTKMSTFKQFVKEQFPGDIMITIPWELHNSITIEDIAFVSIHSYAFILDDKYYEYIEKEGTDPKDPCEKYENITVNHQFENMDNVCFLFAILNEGCHTYIEIVSDSIDEYIIDDHYLDNAWDYAVEHNLTLGLFGDVLRKLGCEPEVYGGQFTSKYLRSE